MISTVKITTCWPGEVRSLSCNRKPQWKQTRLSKIHSGSTQTPEQTQWHDAFQSLLFWASLFLSMWAGRPFVHHPAWRSWEKLWRWCQLPRANSGAGDLARSWEVTTLLPRNSVCWQRWSQRQKRNCKGGEHFQNGSLHNQGLMKQASLHLDGRCLPYNSCTYSFFMWLSYLGTSWTGVDSSRVVRTSDFFLALYVFPKLQPLLGPYSWTKSRSASATRPGGTEIPSCLESMQNKLFLVFTPCENELLIKMRKSEAGRLQVRC